MGSPRIDRVWPAPAERLGIEALAEAFGRPGRDGARRPWVRVNFVSTIDGSAVGADGRSGSISSAADRAVFDVLLIRHTLDVTTWGERKAGDFVNFEVDTMARYAARLADFPSPKA